MANTEQSDDREERIREIAYFLWLEEGCPEGQADQHWAAAETTVTQPTPPRRRPSPAER
jgi:hypothetical protein